MELGGISRLPNAHVRPASGNAPQPNDRAIGRQLRGSDTFGFDQMSLVVLTLLARGRPLSLCRPSHRDRDKKFQN